MLRLRAVVCRFSANNNNNNNNKQTFPNAKLTEKVAQALCSVILWNVTFILINFFTICCVIFTLFRYLPSADRNAGFITVARQRRSRCSVKLPLSAIVLWSISAMHIDCTIIMSSSFRLVYWIGL